LNQKAPSGRKRLLDDLNETGSPFVTSQTPQQREPAANTGVHKGKGLSRIVSVDGTDLFGMFPLKMETDPEANIEIIDLDPTNPEPEGQSEIQIAGSHSRTRTPMVQ
jgi:hypothetical protein